MRHLISDTGADSSPEDLADPRWGTVERGITSVVDGAKISTSMGTNHEMILLKYRVVWRRVAVHVCQFQPFRVTTGSTIAWRIVRASAPVITLVDAFH